MARTRIRAAQRKMVRAAAIAAETEAGLVAQKVYDSALRVQASRRQGGPAYWLLTVCEFIGTEAGARVAKHRGWESQEEVAWVAAYLSAGVYNLVAAMVKDLLEGKDEHFQEWREQASARAGEEQYVDDDPWTAGESAHAGPGASERDTPQEG